MGDITYRAVSLPPTGLSSQIAKRPNNAYLNLLARCSFLLLFLSVVIGQTYRLPILHQGGGLLVSDIGTVAILVSALLYVVFCWQHSQALPRSAFILTGLIVLFSTWSLLCLSFFIPSLPAHGLIIAISYWVRLTSTLLLLPAFIILLENKGLQPFAQRAFWVTCGALCVVGLMQVIFLPSLTFLAHFGWDPHQGRLVGTWLDPNLFGAFLLLLLPVSLAKTFRVHRVLPVLLTILICVDLILTQSRTSFIALSVVAMLLLPLLIISFMRGQQKPSRLVIVISTVGLMILVSILAGVVLQDRLLGTLTGDATTNLHIQSISTAWQQLALPHTVLGVGYNAYQFAAANAGLNSDFAIHSRAGSDNSWLNLWVTTGLLGLILFCLPYLYVSGHIISTARAQKNLYLLAPIISLVLLVVHSGAVNSLLYSHIQIVIAFLLANSLYEPISHHS